MKARDFFLHFRAFWGSGIVLAIYTFLIWAIYPLFGINTLMVSAIPAIMLAWMFGFISGLTGIILQIAIHFVVLRIHGQNFVSTLHLYQQPGMFIGTFTSVLLTLLSAAFSHLFYANKKREEYYHLICDHTHNWEYWQNPAGVLIYSSPSCEQITGYGPEDFIHYPQLLDAIIYPADKPLLHEHWAAVQAHAADHPPEERVYRIFNRARGIRWIEHFCKPVFGADNRFLGRRVSNRDITKRKLAEIEIQQWLQILDLAPGLIIVHNADGRILYANQRAADMHDYNREEFMQLCLHDLAAPESVELMEQRFSTILAQGSLSFEALHVRKNGSIFPLMVHVRPMTWDNATAFLSVCTDISQLKQAEEKLKVNNLLLSAQQEASLDGILIVDESGKILTYNKNFVSMWGIPEAVLALRSDQAAIQCVLAKLKEPDKFIEKVKYLYQRKQDTSQDEINLQDGRVFERYSAPIIGENKIYFGRVWYFRDITKNKKSEAERVQAQKLSSIGQLAAGIAHEINTPIQFIGDNTHFTLETFQDFVPLFQLLQQTVKADNSPMGLFSEIVALAKQIDLDYVLSEIPKALTQTLEGVDRVAAIVRAMKEFAHPESKEKIQADLNKIIQNTLLVSKNEWKYVADIKTDFNPQLPLVDCLPGEIGQVILNLIVNAAHAIKEKQGSSDNKGLISLTTGIKAGQVEIAISDTGAGIPTNIQHRIFEPFFTTKEIGIGTGQGLAIARAIIHNKHHGQIFFETQPGEGTTFKILLPLQAVDQDKAA